MARSFNTSLQLEFWQALNDRLTTHADGSGRWHDPLAVPAIQNEIDLRIARISDMVKLTVQPLRMELKKYSASIVWRVSTWVVGLLAKFINWVIGLLVAGGSGA